MHFNLANHGHAGALRRGHCVLFDGHTRTEDDEIG
jgi:hypothetical protein